MSSREILPPFIRVYELEYIEIREKQKNFILTQKLLLTQYFLEFVCVFLS